MQFRRSHSSAIKLVKNWLNHICLHLLEENEDLVHSYVRSISFLVEKEVFIQRMSLQGFSSSRDLLKIKYSMKIKNKEKQLQSENILTHFIKFDV